MAESTSHDIQRTDEVTMAESTSHDIQRTDEVTMAESISDDIQAIDEDASILDMFKKLDDKEKAARERTRHVYDAGPQLDLHQHRWLEAIEKVFQDASKVADTRKDIAEVKEACQRRMKILEESEDLSYKGDQEKEKSTNIVKDYFRENERCWRELSREVEQYDATRQQMGQEIRRIKNVFEEKRRARDAAREP